MAAITICSDFGAQKIKSDIVSTSISHGVMGPDAMIFIFLMLSFKPTFSLSTFTFIKRLFHSCQQHKKVPFSPHLPQHLSRLFDDDLSVWCKMIPHCSFDLQFSTWEIDGETVETVSDFSGGDPKSLQMVIAAMKLKDPYSLEEKL